MKNNRFIFKMKIFSRSLENKAKKNKILKTEQSYIRFDKYYMDIGAIIWSHVHDSTCMQFIINIAADIITGTNYVKKFKRKDSNMIFACNALLNLLYY